jgi:OOP family OmpA-OmpF porin
MAESLDGTLQRLNHAFKQSFSLQGLKWRLEAFRTGSSYADVVLKHTLEFRVEHLFLIHRKTGLLIKHVAAPQAAAQDPQLVSSMLTAIQDFVQDSFQGAHKQGGGGIDTLRLGDLLLWCEDGPFAFLAVVIRGNPPESLHAELREALGHLHSQFRVPLEEFQGDSGTLGDLVSPLGGCLQQRERPQERQLSPSLWIAPLVLLVLLAGWMIDRAIDRARVDAYVQQLRAQPGVVVAAVEFRSGKWQVSGLRDPLAVDPAALLAKSGLNYKHVVSHWKSYQALDPAMVIRRLGASMNLPPTVSMSVNDGTVEVTGSAPQQWAEQARTLVAALPVGSPKFDFSALTDVQDPEYVRLLDAIQGHIISFDSNVPRPAAGQDAALDAVADEFRQLMRVANRLGFPVRVMISGHSDAFGGETANLSLSAARAEVVRSMLRARGIAPELLTVRSAGPLEPVQAPNVRPTDAMNRRVTFTVITGV